VVECSVRPVAREPKVLVAGAAPGLSCDDDPAIGLERQADALVVTAVPEVGPCLSVAREGRVEGAARHQANEPEVVVPRISLSDARRNDQDALASNVAS
jgi:hypothetical protein